MPEVYDQDFISKADMDLEALVYKRDFTQAQRRKLAGEGKALSDGSYPIETAEDLGPAATLARSGHGDAEGAKRLIARRAKELGVKNPLEGDTEKADVDTASRIIVKSEEQRLVYMVALEPELVDVQGDIIDAAQIEKTAHRWLAEYRQHDIQHDGDISKAIVPVESYCAPCELTFDTPKGPETVQKGAWVIAALVKDDEAWEDVRTGKITGASIAGQGTRTPVPA